MESRYEYYLAVGSNVPDASHNYLPMDAKYIIPPWKEFFLWFDEGSKQCSVCAYIGTHFIQRSRGWCNILPPYSKNLTFRTRFESNLENINHE